MPIRPSCLFLLASYATFIGHCATLHPVHPFHQVDCTSPVPTFCAEPLSRCLARRERGPRTAGDVLRQSATSSYLLRWLSVEDANRYGDPYLCRQTLVVVL
jgi:hypothetical protein